ncbi:TerC family protein [Kordiimonas sp. SCSIO 12610]|uniref:TerC family protein n=1 Tax=Kordiimonas sp. SCSIO 12610 TaxID=2829597 RepID=UPI00210E7F3B|nr:TerC family protein [Kordiimonas sp. SCSIO 12610]UTW54855.1 TerC family protein [Kordiimonas sp. SCSIO 12610]
MDFLLDYNLWVSFITLASLEIILGVDNVVFIALVVEHLEEKQAKTARNMGLILALVARILLLLGVSWIIGLKEPFFELFDHAFSGKDILMLFGGGFLLYKGSNSIHDEITGDKEREYKAYSGVMMAVVAQIVLIDIIFSFDSVMTAVGLTENIGVIIAAMTVAMAVMLFSASYISDFIARFPTLKVLALAFILLIGVFLVAEGLGQHIPKGYIYFSMAFALGVEVVNLLVRGRKAAKKQKNVG